MGELIWVISVLISIVIVFITYTAIPLTLRYQLKKSYTKKEARNIAILNSLFVAFFWVVFRSAVGIEQKVPLTLILYYFVNMWLLTREKGLKDKEIIVHKNEVKDSSKVTNNEIYNNHAKEENVDTVYVSCVICQRGILTESKFCKFCGTDQTILEKRFCRKCGLPIEEDSKYCDSCGVQVRV